MQCRLQQTGQEGVPKEPNCFWPKNCMADGQSAGRLFAWITASLRYGIIV
jgi:hypothetical protein